MRKLALVMAVALASGRASALGLGDIELHSALNQPFSAEIRLIVDQPAELEGAVVRLAPQESFQQAGINRPAALSDLNFNVLKRADGSAVIQVTSSQPMREPYLDFIVQLRWPTGRLLREYTVLLDPPVFSGNKLAPVTAPVATAPAPQAPRAAAPSVAAEPVAKPASPAPARPASSAVPSVVPARPQGEAPSAKRVTPGTYGPTQRTDTAWTIATQVRPDSGVTLYQTMLALLAANPDAFYNGNINNLLAGYVLRVPDRELMTALSAQEAEREAARQYQQWRQAKRGVPMASDGEGTTALGATPTTSASTQGEVSPRLKLVAPGTATSGAPGSTKQAIEDVRGDLAMALESADAARRENEELRGRLAALEGQISSMQRLLTLKDPTLGNLQGESAGPTATPVAPSTDDGFSLQTPGEMDAAPAPAAQDAPAETPGEEAGPAFDLFDNPSFLAMAGGGALLLLALAWLVIRRRRAEDNDEDTVSEMVESGPVADAMPAVAAAPESAPSTVPPVTAAVESVSTPLAESEEVVTESAGADAKDTAEDLDVLHTSEGDIDPIVEADVYLAYRRYQQAEALIQGALSKNPQRHELKAKLLEIYYASRNIEAFRGLAETLFEELGQNTDDILWQRILPMGAELLPTHHLFNAAPAGTKSTVPSATAGASAALFAGDISQEVAELGEAEPQPVDDSDDLFAAEPADKAEQDLDMDLDAAVTEAGGEESLDLDLNLGSDGQTDDLAAELALPGDKAREKSAGLDDELLSEATGDQGKAESWDVDSAMSDFGSMDFNLDDSDFLAGTDVVGTKLDLARAYIDMGDQESARDILNEVLAEGNDQQKQEAKTLSQQLA